MKRESQKRPFVDGSWPKAVGSKRAHGRSVSLSESQDIAVKIARARPNRMASIDDVQHYLIKAGKAPLRHNAGSVFTPRKRWALAGWHPSTRLSNRHRAQRIWRLIEK